MVEPQCRTSTTTGIRAAETRSRVALLVGLRPEHDFRVDFLGHVLQRLVATFGVCGRDQVARVESAQVRLQLVGILGPGRPILERLVPRGLGDIPPVADADDVRVRLEALQLSYPLSQSRASQDVDAVYASSKQTFEQNLVNSLKQGWGGFTGTVDRLPHGPKTLLPEGKGMARYTVKLLYLGKPFTSIYVEAVPDINACANHARHRMDDGTARLLEQLGLPVQTILVMDPLTQMAEKMHALCRPGKIRGKDIADLTLMLEHEDVNLEALRQACRSVEKVQGQHVIGRLDDDRKADYRRQYEEAGPPSRFNDAWDAVRTLLEQVDEQCRDRWLDSWQDVLDREQAWRAFDPARLDGSPRHGMQPRKPAGSPNSTGGQYDSLQ